MLAISQHKCSRSKHGQRTRSKELTGNLRFKHLAVSQHKHLCHLSYHSLILLPLTGFTIALPAQQKASKKSQPEQPDQMTASADTTNPPKTKFWQASTNPFPAVPFQAPIEQEQEQPDASKCKKEWNQQSALGASSTNKGQNADEWHKQNATVAW
ncbi:hypothetical protein GJ744_011204 [Endocarpon pusillum]|uniref:Uncharacterized protein n=1 Tax=Endocarpon pusillum TaxID=364733 RepID=A0A8H7ADG8_9EURO|nr:hypothetical protein GJ744_011204 [Endocarpon pusillum]